jgi:prophage regulatory protein
MHQSDIGRPEPVLRWPALQPLVGVSRTTWWRMVRAGQAPAPVRLSQSCVGWPESAIKAFQASRASKMEAA